MNQPAIPISNVKYSLEPLSGLISSGSYSQVFVLLDENTLQHCYTKLSSHLPLHQIIEIKSGEENKTVSTCEFIWEKLTKANADRHSLMINLGGGVIGDMGGFAASCYKRGIRFMQIPTTLLAMVDASVGGKTGIDFMGFKNQIGIFSQPDAIIIDTHFLKNLPERQLISGFAEVIKHYLIYDRVEFAAMRNADLNIRDYLWDKIVARNVEIKSDIVKRDPMEQNIRKALNFGHTIGHAVESYYMNSEIHALLHGEAVAIGMIAESFISMKQNLLSEEELNAISFLILDYFQLPTLPAEDFKVILELVQQDKKNESQKNQFTLLEGIGKYKINCFVEREIMLESLNYYNSRIR